MTLGCAISFLRKPSKLPKADTAVVGLFLGTKNKKKHNTFLHLENLQGVSNVGRRMPGCLTFLRLKSTTQLAVIRSKRSCSFLIMKIMNISFF